MNIDIQANGIPAHKDVHRFVACRTDLALGSMRDQVGLVSVFVDEAGEDSETRCRVLIRPSAQPDIIVEGRNANLYAAIHHTLDDAGWTLADSLMRQQSDFIQQQFELIDDQFTRSQPSGLTDRAA